MALLRSRVAGYFGTVPVALTCSPNLSHGAARVGAYLFGKPNGWDCENWKIKKDLGIKSDRALAGYWKELVADGWVYRARKRDKETGGYVGGFDIGLDDQLREPEDKALTDKKGQLGPNRTKEHIRQKAILGKKADTTHNSSFSHNSSPNHKDFPEKKPKPVKRFAPPSVEECKSFFKEKDESEDEGERFFFHYSSNGWRVGKVKMKEWKMSAAGWISRNKTNRASAGSKKEKNDEIIGIEYD